MTDSIAKIDLTDNKPKMRLHWQGNVSGEDCEICYKAHWENMMCDVCGGPIVYRDKERRLCSKHIADAWENKKKREFALPACIHIKSNKMVEVDVEVFHGVQDANWSLVVVRDKFKDFEWFPLDKTLGRPIQEIILESLLVRFQNGEPVEGVREVSE